MSQQTAPTPHLRANSERGSAFVITLLSMVVLGIILLSLSVITETERQIATNELMSNRVLYAADTGLNLAIARALTVGSTSGSNNPANPQPMNFFVPEATLAGAARGQQITVTPFFPLRAYYCGGCNADLGTDPYYVVNHAVSSTATRVTWTGAATTPPATASRLASKQTYFQVGFSPWHQPSIDAINPNNDYSAISQDTKGVHQAP